MDRKRYKVLLVDDELGWCKALKSGLQENDLEVEYETKAENAVKLISSFNPHVVLLDILFNNIKKGKAIFKDIKIKYPDLTVIILTCTVVEDDFRLEDYPGCAFAYAKEQLISGTSEAYKEFAEKIRRAIKNQSTTMESLQEEFAFIVGKTKAMKRVCKDILKVAPTNTTILITGESGVGKGLVASAIKDKSKRGDKKFITKSCADFTNENLLISELFGHEKGAFTGAGDSHQGIFEEAAGGTVFIDEIGDASPEAQGRLLRVLQEKTIRRMNGNKDIKTDVRVLTATNKDLQDLIRVGKFREDLFHRINQYRIHVPPLRERREDIPEMLAYFIRKFNEEDNKNILIETKSGVKNYLRSDVLDLLREYDWPGNIREFENTVHRAMINAGDSNILLTNYFDIDVKQKKHKTPFDIDKLIEEVFEKKWHGEEKWNEFIKTYITKGWQKEILQGCIDRLKKNKQGTIRYKDMADLFGITENNMRQRIHVLEIDWKEKTRS